MAENTQASAGRILVVDDEPDMRSGLKAILRRLKFEVELAGTVPEALTILGESPVDLVLTDLTLPGKSGIDLLETVRQDHPETLVILFRGFATVATAVEAIRKGAIVYMP